MTAIDAFWEAMPGMMRLILAIVIGATFHFMRNRALPLAEGITGTIFAIIGGLMFCVGVNYILKWDLKQAWPLGAVVSFMFNYMLGGLETTGEQIKQSGVKWLIDTAIDSFVSAKEKLGIGKPKA